MSSQDFKRHLLLRVSPHQLRSFIPFSSLPHQQKWQTQQTHRPTGATFRRSHFQISELETAEKLSVDRESIKDSSPPMRRAGEDGGTVTRDGACAPVNQDESAVDVSFIDSSVGTFAHSSNVDASAVVDIWLAQRTPHVSCGIETEAQKPKHCC